MTLRQLFYRLVSDRTLLNTRAEYNQLSSRTAAARRDPERSFPTLIDRTRGIVQPAFWDSPAAARKALRDQYRRDRTEGQPYTIYLGVEKAGIVEQLRRWFGIPLGLPVLPLGGYHSQPFEREISGASAAYDRPSVLLYAGDLDASGEDIERNFLRWNDFGMSNRIALTLEQAQEHELPPMPGKHSDTRSAGFAAKYGGLFQIEVDALPPDVLRRAFEDAIGGYWDDDAYQVVLAREANEREEL